MDEAFDALFQFHECTVFRDIGDAAFEGGTDRIFRGNAFPRIGHELFHAERDALGFLVDLDDLDFDRLADFHHFGRVANAAPRHVGDVQQAVNAAEINERTVIGDVLDDAVTGFAFGQLADEFSALFGAAFFEDGAARDHDIAARTVHFQDCERLFLVHQRADIADRTDINLGTRQEGRSAAQIHSEATLDATDDGTVDRILLVEGLLEAVPALFAASLVAREDGVAEGVFDALEINFDIVADFRGFRARAGEFAKRDATFGLEANIDNDIAILDGGNGAFDDLAFSQIAPGQAGFQHGGEIISRRGKGFCRHVKGLLRGSGTGLFCMSRRLAGFGRLELKQCGRPKRVRDAVWVTAIRRQNARLSATLLSTGSRLLAFFHNRDSVSNGRVYTQG